MENLGKLFRVEREKMRLSIDEVSERTKIRAHIIQAMEEERFDALPSVYMKAFIKDYSRFLKLKIDEEEVISQFAPKDSFQKLAEESVKQVAIENENPKNYEEIFAEKRIKKNFFNKTSFATYLIYSALVLILLAIVYFAFFDFSSKTEKPASSDSLSGPTPTTVGENGGLNPAQKATMDSMNLVISAKDTVWILIAMDGKASRQMVLAPGKDLDVNAWDYFQLTCDNASVIDVKRNGELLPKLSNRGKVIRNVKITRTDIINPTSVFSDSTYRRRKAKKAEEANKNTPVVLPPARDRNMKTDKKTN
jgi:hypothetical protein